MKNLIISLALAAFAPLAQAQINIVNNGSWTVGGMHLSDISRFNITSPNSTGSIVGAVSSSRGVPGAVRGVGYFRGFVTAGSALSLPQVSQQQQYVQLVTHNTGSGTATLNATATSSGSRSASGQATGSITSQVRVRCDLLSNDLVLNHQVTEAFLSVPTVVTATGSAVTSGFNLETQSGSVAQANVPLNGGITLLSDVAVTGTLTLN